MNPILYRGMEDEPSFRSSIKELQKLIKENGINISIDGFFGPGTESKVKKFQSKTKGLSADGVVGQLTWKALKGMSVKVNDADLGIPSTDYFLEDDEYYKDIVDKDTVYLHDTRGGGNAYFVIQSWEKDKNRVGDSLKVGTAFIIARESKSRNPKFNCKDGELFRAFDEKYWAHHLGIRSPNNTELNAKSIGIEICSYGPLRKNKNGDYITLYGNVIHEDEVFDHGVEWRGYRYWHKYSDAQLETLRNLLNALKKKFNLNYQECFGGEFFEYNYDALKGTPGIWTHVNVRDYPQDNPKRNKYDCFPQPELIEVLNSLDK